MSVASGDTDAFEELYGRISGRVFGLVQRVVRNPAQSEEVAQEVLVEIWRTAGHFDPRRAGANTWVTTMAHHRAVDQVRSAQASMGRDSRIALLEVDVPVDDVSEQVEHRLEYEEVRRALSLLSDLQREAVQLAYFGGHTYGEVATLLNLPLGTIKTRIRDALIRLRAALQATC